MKRIIILHYFANHNVSVTKLSHNKDPGRALTLEASTGCAASRPSFSGHFLSSGNPPFQALFQLQIPHFYFLKYFALSSQIFAKFQLLETLRLKIWAAHIYPQIFLVPEQR